jgi:hypothetical protein
LDQFQGLGARAPLNHEAGQVGTGRNEAAIRQRLQLHIQNDFTAIPQENRKSGWKPDENLSHDRS